MPSLRSVVLRPRALQFVNNAMSSYWTDEDDMLFAVFRNPAGKTPFMAIRRDPGVLPNELMYGSDMYNSIDWKATVLLNMAMHARFRLTLTVGGYCTKPLSDGSTVTCAARDYSCVLKSSLLFWHPGTRTYWLPYSQVPSRHRAALPQHTDVPPHRNCCSDGRSTSTRGSPGSLSTRQAGM